MAVLPMQHIRIYALKQNRKAILELLQRRGAVQITDSKTDSPVFEKMDTATAQHTFEKSDDSSAGLSRCFGTGAGKRRTPKKTGRPPSPYAGAI